MHKAALVETHQPASRAANQNPPSKILLSSFSESFISSSKQGGGATVLREGHDIVTRETCNSYFSEQKQLKKSSYAAFCLQLGPCQTQPVIEHNCAYVGFS
jgi:hypothetical protein